MVKNIIIVVLAAAVGFLWWEQHRRCELDEVKFKDDYKGLLFDGLAKDGDEAAWKAECLHHMERSFGQDALLYQGITDREKLSTKSKAKLAVIRESVNKEAWDLLKRK